MCKESREWRGIGGYPDYEISSDGLVRRITPTGHRPVGIRKKKNGYMEVKVFLNGKRKYFLVHRLVCIAFNGEAPSEKHQVNHDDGNKENNLYTNLEWSTGKGNQNHARDTGLSNCSYKILVHNIVKRTSVLYRSMELVMAEFALTKSAVETYVRGYPNAIYNQFYKFELVYTDNNTKIRSDAKPYRVMDYVEGTEFLVHGARLTSYLTKVSEIVVRYNLGNNRMVNGYMFKSADDLSPFIPHPPEIAMMSREDYSKGIQTERKLIVKDLRSGKSTTYNTVAEAALLLRLPIGTIYRRLSQSSTEPFKGYSFQHMANFNNELKRAA